jgi:hypothetical protein
MRKPCLVVQLDEAPSVETVSEWIAAHRIRSLNIAGPRESQQPGIYALAIKFLTALLRHASR